MSGVAQISYDYIYFFLAIKTVQIFVLCQPLTKLRVENVC